MRCLYELSGVLHGDAMIFQTVGRGILNGIKPYSGLFETKPPGLFLLHAVSLWMTDSQLVVKVFQVIALFSIPVLFVIPAVHAAQGRSVAQRQVLALVSILFGIILSLYTANQAGMGLGESYGVALCLAYMFMLNRPYTWMRTVALGVVMLTTIGLREPFLLVLLACVVLLEQNVIQSFVYPLLVAAVLGFFALLFLGYAEPFFQVYLPHMFGFHVHQHDRTLPLRALEVWRTFINMGYAYSWWMAVAITMMWGTAFFEAARQSRSLVLRLLCALYLMFLAIAVGGDFYGHHFIFAVPCYAALYVWMVKRDIWKPRLMMVFASLLIVTAYVDTQYVYDSSTWKTEEAEYKRVASVIDTVMDNCGYDKYLQMIVRGGGPYAYTKHSPYGPIFVHYSRFIGGSQWYQAEHIRALKETPLVFILDIENSNLTDMAQQFMGVNFSEDAPECAGGAFQQPSPYHLLFRQK